MIADCALPDPRIPTLWGAIPVPPFGWTWSAIMQRALQEADCAARAGEIPVGAVVLDKNGRILAAAHNQSVSTSNPIAHAEILALQQAGKTTGNYRLQDCILAVTLEPCLMCAGALVHARLAGLIYGAADMKTGAVQTCMNALDLPFLNHRVWHMGGILAAECTAKLQDFFAACRHP